MQRGSNSHSSTRHFAAAASSFLSLHSSTNGCTRAAPIWRAARSARPLRVAWSDLRDTKATMGTHSGGEVLLEAMKAVDLKKLLEQVAADWKVLLRDVPYYISSPEDKKEIVQEALRKLTETDLTRLRTPELIRSYAQCTVRNVAHDWVRNPLHRAKYVVATDQLIDAVLRRTQDNLTPEEINSAREQKLLVRKALNTLSHTTRQVLYLRVWEGCSQMEIAERLQLSPKSVGSMASVGFEQLSRELEKLLGNAERRRDKL